MDLDVKVYEASCRGGEDAPWVTLSDITELPREAMPSNPGDNTILAESLKDGSALKTWAFFFGMAYAVERLDHPLDSEERWQERAP